LRVSASGVTVSPMPRIPAILIALALFVGPAFAEETEKKEPKKPPVKEQPETRPDGEQLDYANSEHINKLFTTEDNEVRPGSDVLTKEGHWKTLKFLGQLQEQGKKQKDGELKLTHASSSKDGKKHSFYLKSKDEDGKDLNHRIKINLDGSMTVMRLEGFSNVGPVLDLNKDGSIKPDAEKSPPVKRSPEEAKEYLRDALTYRPDLGGREGRPFHGFENVVKDPPKDPQAAALRSHLLGQIAGGATLRDKRHMMMKSDPSKKGYDLSMPILLMDNPNGSMTRIFTDTYMYKPPQDKTGTTDKAARDKVGTTPTGFHVFAVVNGKDTPLRFDPKTGYVPVSMDQVTEKEDLPKGWHPHLRTTEGGVFRVHPHTKGEGEFKAEYVGQYRRSDGTVYDVSGSFAPTGKAEVQTFCKGSQCFGPTLPGVDGPGRAKVGSELESNWEKLSPGNRTLALAEKPLKPVASTRQVAQAGDKANVRPVIPLASFSKAPPTPGTAKDTKVAEPPKPKPPVMKRTTVKVLRNGRSVSESFSIGSDYSVTTYKGDKATPSKKLVLYLSPESGSLVDPKTGEVVGRAGKATSDDANRSLKPGQLVTGDFAAVINGKRHQYQKFSMQLAGQDVVVVNGLPEGLRYGLKAESPTKAYAIEDRNGQLWGKTANGYELKVLKADSEDQGLGFKTADFSKQRDGSLLHKNGAVKIVDGTTYVRAFGTTPFMKGGNALERGASWVAMDGIKTTGDAPSKKLPPAPKGLDQPDEPKAPSTVKPEIKTSEVKKPASKLAAKSDDKPAKKPGTDYTKTFTSLSRGTSIDGSGIMRNGKKVGYVMADSIGGNRAFLDTGGPLAATGKPTTPSSQWMVWGPEGKIGRYNDVKKAERTSVWDGRSSTTEVFRDSTNGNRLTTLKGDTLARRLVKGRVVLAPSSRQTNLSEMGGHNGTVEIRASSLRGNSSQRWNTLSEVAGGVKGKTVVIVTGKSTNGNVWCPPCQALARQMSARKAEFQRRGINVIEIGSDDPVSELGVRVPNVRVFNGGQLQSVGSNVDSIFNGFGR